MPSRTTQETLAQALLAAVHAQDFANTADARRAGAPLAHFPSIDLAVAAFSPSAPPCWANVLFSCEHPQGLVARIPADAAAVQGLRFDADLTDAQGNSVAWAPDADWQRLPWRTLYGSGPVRVVAPYPASLLKLMVAVGIGLGVDAGLLGWPDALEPMIVVSDNDATTACVALLHRHGLVDVLHGRFAALGLPTLKLQDTKPDGGWRNGDGSGVGHIHMTAWDTVRLLWLLDADAPPAPWLAADAPALLQPATRAHLRGVLQRQQLDHVLSSGSLRHLPGWVPGLPDAPAFAHKTGNTENYTADAGIVRSGRTHYLVALLSNLGQRYAPHPDCATTWRVPALGAALHGFIESTP